MSNQPEDPRAHEAIKIINTIHAREMKELESKCARRADEVCAGLRHALYLITIQGCDCVHPDGCVCCLEESSVQSIAQEQLDATTCGQPILDRVKRLEEALNKIANLDYSKAATNGAAYEAVQIAKQAIE